LRKPNNQEKALSALNRHPQRETEKKGPDLFLKMIRPLIIITFKLTQ